MSVQRLQRTNPKTGDVRTFWLVDVDFKHPDGTRERIRKVSPVHTKRGAEQYEGKLRQSLIDGTYKQIEREVPTVNAFSQEFMQNYSAANNKPSTMAAKEQILRTHLLPAFGELRLDQVDVRQVEAFKARKVVEERHPKTVNNCLTVLRKMLAVAQEWRLIAHVPAIKWMRVPKPRFDFLRFDEASRLLAAVDEDWRAMVTVAVRTGLRQGELLALRWDEVDLNARKLTVRFSAWKGKIGSPKSGRARELPLTPETVALLSKLCRRESGFVFCKADGSPFTKGECKHPLWRACRTAGLRRIGWHVLRHTFASHLVMRGVPLKAVQELMGHATIEMTMRYAHLSPEMRTDSVDLLDRPPPVQGNGNLTTTGQGGVTM